ncbi:hypothetical protein K438DRAFT_170779 [Mycena galopus ATCC 62051]|nr:hypothetical protein K438DRAFT_170779 [Mycena galopus ATCC 62051]
MTQTEAQELWKTDLEPTAIQILTESEPLSFAAHAAAYSATFNFITRVKTDGRGRVADSSDLYAQVKLFFTQYTSGIAAAAPTEDGTLPEYYDSEWDRFSRGARGVERLLHYLNRRSVGAERSEGRKTIRNVRDDISRFVARLMARSSRSIVGKRRCSKPSALA